MELLTSIGISVLATLVATIIVNVLIHFLGGISFIYWIINKINHNKKRVFVFKEHPTNILKWKDYWKIFKNDGYKIIIIKKQNEKTWKIINYHLKKTDDISIAGYPKAEYAIYIGWMGSKKETTVFYKTQNSKIKKMTYTGEEFNFAKKTIFKQKQKKITILQNKKSVKNYNSKNLIDISTENEHPDSLNYIFNIKKIASILAKNNKEIEITFIGKSVFAFAFAQLFSYEAHKIYVESYDNESKKYNLINLMEKTKI